MLAVWIAEAELASAAARPRPRQNQTSGLMFVLKTIPWRPGDLSGAGREGGTEPKVLTVGQKCGTKRIALCRKWREGRGGAQGRTDPKV